MHHKPTYGTDSYRTLRETQMTLPEIPTRRTQLYERCLPGLLCDRKEPDELEDKIRVATLEL